MNFRNYSIGKKIAVGIGIALVCLAGFGLFIWGLQYLWNWLVPDIFGWRAISYWQMLGLFVLSKILFKGITFNSRGYRWNNRCKQKWTEKWEGMSPEDRERFKQKMRERCSWGQPTQPQ